MTTSKTTTKFPGVRYRTHKTRKHMGKYDKYFSVRYRINGKAKEEGIGWSSMGWSAVKASTVLADLKKAHLTKEGPQTLSEKRETALAEQLRIEKETLSFSRYFNNRYYPEAKENKHWKSYKREESLFRLWIKPVIGKMPFKDIRPFHIEIIKKAMRDEGKAPRSIQYALATTRQIFNHAIKNEAYQGGNPVTKISMPKVDNKRQRFLTHHEADTLLKEVRSRSLQLYEIALISLHCGLRASEIFRLNWGCVHIERRCLLLMDTKGDINRTVYMTNEVERVFSQKDPDEPSFLVFTSQKGDIIKEISNTFARIIDEVGFNDGIEDSRHKVFFHTLRHTYASWLVQEGVDIYTVKDLMGHSTLAMTERYAHLAPNNLKSAVDVLQKSLSNHKTEKKLTTIDKKI